VSFTFAFSKKTGYNNRKQETGNRKQETGNRKQETGNRKQETGIVLKEAVSFSPFFFGSRARSWRGRTRINPIKRGYITYVSESALVRFSKNLRRRHSGAEEPPIRPFMFPSRKIWHCDFAVATIQQPYFNVKG
jgi:hypothetical protein